MKCLDERRFCLEDFVDPAVEVSYIPQWVKFTPEESVTIQKKNLKPLSDSPFSEQLDINHHAKDWNMEEIEAQSDLNVRNNIFSDLEEAMKDDGKGPKFFKAFDGKSNDKKTKGFDHEPDHSEKARNPLYAGVVI